MTAVDDLAQWLGEQLDTGAREIADPYAEKAWHARDCGIHPDVWGNEGSSCDCGVPARVLREIDAKRQQLDLHQPEPGQHPDFCGYDKHELPCRPLRLLALSYTHRPGYQESWRP